MAISWLPIADIARKLQISEHEILVRRALGDISFSERTDKYNIDSVFQTRTMTIGIEKYLTAEERISLIEEMKVYTQLKFQLVKKLQNGEIITNSGKNRVHREMGFAMGLQQVYADSALAEATGIVNSAKTWKEKHEQNLKDDIESIEKKFKEYSNSKLRQAYHYKRMKLEKSLNQNHKPLWFGRKYKNEIKENKQKYEESRLSLYATGTAGLGNAKFGLVSIDNRYGLKINKKIFRNIKIPSAHNKTFSTNGYNRQSCRISFNDKGKLILNITYSYIKPIKKANIERSRGTIGIDIGPKEIAVAYVKNDGNPFMYKHYNIGGLLDARKDNKERILSEILEKIIDDGIDAGFTHITIEDLTNLKFKKNYKNKALNRMLSKFPKTIFVNLMDSKCARKGIKLKKINPAYTSIIGIYKYSNRDNLSFAHNANSKDLSAALVIGRRGLGLYEREVVCLRTLGRTVSLTYEDLLLTPEDVSRNETTGRDFVRPNFWHKIALFARQSLTEIPEDDRLPIHSSPSYLADFLEMRANACRMSRMASRETLDVLNQTLPF